MKSLSATIVKFVILVFVGTVVLSLLRTIWNSHKALQNVDKQEATILQLEKQTSKLEEQVQQATSSFELEKRAREQLNLQRENESVIRVN